MGNTFHVSMTHAFLRETRTPRTPRTHFFQKFVLLCFSVDCLYYLGAIFPTYPFMLCTFPRARNLRDLPLFSPARDMHIHHVHHVHIFFKNSFSFVFQSIVYIIWGLSSPHTHLCYAPSLVHATCAIYLCLVRRETCTHTTYTTYTFFSKIRSPLFFSRLFILFGGYLPHIRKVSHTINLSLCLAPNCSCSIVFFTLFFYF
jgi:hypothetical protein